MTRLHWSELPASLLTAVEGELGGTVVDVANASGGYSPGFVARVATRNGDRCFVKAMSRATNPAWVFLYEREARIAPHLPDGAPFPRWRFTVDDGDWIALGFDVIDGREATIPWAERDLQRVLAAHSEIAERARVFAPMVESAGDAWGDAFARWDDFLRDPELERRLPAGWRDHVGELARMESTWPTLVQGNDLVHLDLRADNLLLTADEVYVVDWAFAARGQPWMDLVCLLPNVAMRGGPDPEAVWQEHRWHRSTDPIAFNAFLAGWAGMLTHLALSDTSPALRDLRSLHAAQAAEARRWLARRLGWPHVAELRAI